MWQQLFSSVQRASAIATAQAAAKLAVNLKAFEFQKSLLWPANVRAPLMQRS